MCTWGTDLAGRRNREQGTWSFSEGKEFQERSMVLLRRSHFELLRYQTAVAFRARSGKAPRSLVTSLPVLLKLLLLYINSNEIIPLPRKFSRGGVHQHCWHESPFAPIAATIFRASSAVLPPILRNADSQEIEGLN